MKLKDLYPKRHERLGSGIKFLTYFVLKYILLVIVTADKSLRLVPPVMKNFVKHGFYHKVSRQ